MGVKKKNTLTNEEEIELLDNKIEEKEKRPKKEKKGIVYNVFLILSITSLLLSIGVYYYVYNKNQKLENEINSSKENVTKVEEAIKNDQKAITEKEDEYEKLKEKVKDNLEELNIWEALKEELNKSLS